MAKSVFDEAQRQRIQQLCDVDHFSQSKVAQLYDVSQGTISNVLKEERLKSEIKRQNEVIRSGFVYGVKSAIEDGTLTPNANYLIEKND